MKNDLTHINNDLHDSLVLKMFQRDEDIVEQYSMFHKKLNFEILWVQEGSGFHVVNEMKYPFDYNTIFCCAPGQIRHLIADAGLKACVMSFSESFLRHGHEDESGIYDSNLYSIFFGSSVIRIEKEVAEEMNDIALKMEKESRGDLSLRTELLRRYLKIFLLYLLRQYDACSGSSSSCEGNRLVKKFINAVERQYKTKKMVAEYAEQLSVTTNYLNQVVKQVTGHSAGYHIRHRIIQEAKRKATYSDLNLKEIAYDLGFDAPSHFSKFFKNYAGMNFTLFKQQEVEPGSSTFSLVDNAA